MLISNIEPVTKDRSRITLEDGQQFVMYKGELRLFAMKAGTALSDEHYHQIMTVVLPRRAKLRMMALLKQRDYTGYQLSSKLLEAGYPREVVDEALAYVKSFGYVDDRRYVQDYIKSQCKTHSRKEIIQKLSQKGIEHNLIDDVYSELTDEAEQFRECNVAERDLILKTLNKRGFTGNESYEDRQKMLAYFYRRGFSMDEVYRAMDELKQKE